MAVPKKSPDAFRTISEASAELDVPQHVLRHWEDAFGQIRPMRRAGGRRYYRPLDLDLLRGVRVLLYDERYTTKGVQKIFKENGAKYIMEIGRLSAAGEPIELHKLLQVDVLENADKATDQAETVPQKASAVSDVDLQALEQKLSTLLTRLRNVQDSLDEAALAIDEIDPQD